jgi:glucan phosphoethanolaminetransferase (alkaline phosphatase superfamily)
MKKSLLEKIAVFYLVALLLAPMLIALAYSPKNATGFFYSAMNCLVYIAIVSLIATSGFLALFTILISPIILFWSGFLILFECAPHATIFINLLRTPQHEIFNWLVGHFLITIGTFSLFLIAAIAAYLTGLTGKTKLSIRRVHEYALLSTALILSGLMIYFDVQSSKSGYRESDHWSAVFAPPNPTLLTQLNDTLWPLGAARRGAYGISGINRKVLALT